MSDWIAVNGVPILARTENASIKSEDIGETVRAVDGSLISDRRATKRTIEFDTPPMALDQARWIQALVNGQHDCWPLHSNLYSSKGRPAILAGGASLSGLSGFTTTGRVALTSSGSIEFYPFEVGTTNGATIFMHLLEGATWRTEIACYDPNSGVLSAYKVTGSTLSTSSLLANWDGASNDIIFYASGIAYSISDVMIVPQYIDPSLDLTTFATWAVGFHSFAYTLPLAPRLVVSGDMSPLRNNYLGRAESGRVLATRRGGSFRTTDHSLTVRLEEA